jgi:hypothetical protein
MNAKAYTAVFSNRSAANTYAKSVRDVGAINCGVFSRPAGFCVTVLWPSTEEALLLMAIKADKVYDPRTGRQLGK